PEMLAVLPYERDRAGLARALASADLYVAPFPMETFGLAAVEAMACGLPVVGVNSGAMADLLTGACWARLSRPGNATDFARAVQDLLSQNLEALRADARKTAERYAWHRTFGDLFRAYHSLNSVSR
ncbi:MAG TPA: glycosyltransferase, partial [Gemmatimonadales bacterium]|nr:glycosyltransferase [Gemmatimonadales bacterium]